MTVLKETTTDGLKKKELDYLMAVGHYRNGNYTITDELLNNCLSDDPKYWKASALQRAIKKSSEKGMSLIVNLEHRIC